MLVVVMVIWDMVEVDLFGVVLEWVRGLFFNLMNWYCWYVNFCDLGGFGVIVVIYFWELGCDNFLDWDDVLRVVEVKDVEFYVCKDMFYVDLVMWLCKEDYDCYLSIVVVCWKVGWDLVEVVGICLFFVVDFGVIFIFLCVCWDFLVFVEKFE